MHVFTVLEKACDEDQLQNVLAWLGVLVAQVWEVQH
jgi:uncharacterized protein (DUF2267 family)